MNAPVTPAAELRTRYLRALARYAAAWRLDCHPDEALVFAEPCARGRRAYAAGPAFSSCPDGVGDTEDAAFVALVEAAALPPTARSTCAVKAALETGAWVPLPGDVIDREGAVALAVAPSGRRGWTVSGLDGRVDLERGHFTVRTEADRRFLALTGREPALRPADLPEAVRFLPMEGP